MSEVFDPNKVTTYRPVTVVAVGGSTRQEMAACDCGEHRDRYYVHGVEGHYVRASDYDSLLALYRAAASPETPTQIATELGASMHRERYSL